MAKQKTHKRTRMLEGEIKRLQAENKRLKKNPHTGSDFDRILDKDEIDYEPDLKMVPCVHCKSGLMQEVELIGRLYWKCVDCNRTKRV